MLGRKVILSAAAGQRQISTTCLRLKGSQLNKQVHMLKKIMNGGREKGKRRFIFSDNLPKLETVKKLSDTKGQGKESGRRVTVLNKLFMKNITDLMATDKFAKNITGYGIQVSCVKVSPDFRSLNVFWIAKNDENDLLVEEILKSMGGPLRHELSQLRLMGEVPRIYFVRDRHFSKAVEVDTLLARADFGEDFVPTDPTLFMKAKLELQMTLPEHIREQIYETEKSFEDEDYEEQEIPEMRNDVLGIDHSLIMKKITASMDKTKRAWESFETRTETILADATPTRDLSVIQLAVNKMNREAEVRNDFVKFLERRQYARKQTPERKKHINYLPIEDEEIIDHFFDQDDYLDDEHDREK